jgi:hypothetical protein
VFRPEFSIAGGRDPTVPRVQDSSEFDDLCP